MANDKEKMLELTAQEVFLLCTKIPNEGTDFSVNSDFVAVNLLLKLFSVFNELVTDTGMKKGTLCISVTEREAWVLRKYVSPTDTDSNGVPIGVILSRKIYEILLYFNAVMTSVELEDLLPGTITEEEVEKERRKYHGAARQEPDCNADPDADSGKEDEIPRNPFYRSSRGPITEDYINRMIAALDDEFSKEVTKNPDYHWKNSGSTIPPEFHRLGPKAKRALVEGLDRLMGHERSSSF